MIDGSSGSVVVGISAENVEINRFTIQKGGRAAFESARPALKILYNKFAENGWDSNYCYVHNVRGQGDVLFQYNDVVADESRAHTVNYGFYSWGNSDDNQVNDNDFHGASGNAIYIKGYDYHVSVDNVVSGNDISGGNAAMQLESLSSTEGYYPKNLYQ